MPFVCKSGHKVATVNNAYELPLFIIPGILGTGEDVQPFVDNLHPLNKMRPIYVYEDSRATNLDACTKKKTIDEQVQEIIEGIKECVPKPVKFFPFFMVGYSFGGILATLVGQKLLEENQQKKSCYRPNIYIIDNLPPQSFKNTYAEHPEKFLKTLTKIVNAASLLPEADYVTLSEDEIKQISLLPLEKQAFYLKLKLEDKIPMSSKAEFENKIAIAIENLNALLHYTPATVNKLDDLFLLITNKTNNKFGPKFISEAWHAHTKKLTSIKNEDLQMQSHFNVIKNKELALSICDFFKLKVPPKEYLKELEELHEIQKKEAEKKEKQPPLSDDEYNTSSDTPVSLEENSDSSDSNPSTPLLQSLTPTIERRNNFAVKKNTFFNNLFNQQDNHLNKNTKNLLIPIRVQS